MRLGHRWRLVHKKEGTRRLQEAADHLQLTRRLQAEHVDVDGEDFVEARCAKVDIGEGGRMDLGPARGQARLVAPARGARRDLGSVDDDDIPAFEPFADQREGDATPAADLEDEVVRLDVEQLHGPPQSLRDRHPHPFSTCRARRTSTAPDPHPRVAATSGIHGFMGSRRYKAPEFGLKGKAGDTDNLSL